MPAHRYLLATLIQLSHQIWVFYGSKANILELLNNAFYYLAKKSYFQNRPLTALRGVDELGLSS